MSRSAFTLNLFGFYLLAIGAVLTFVPNILLSILQNWGQITVFSNIRNNCDLTPVILYEKAHNKALVRTLLTLRRTA